MEDLLVTREIFIPTSLDRVWDFLLNEKKMAAWLKADEFDVDIWGGGNIDMPFSFDGHECRITGEVTILLPPKKYALTWREKKSLFDEWFNTTTVTLDLEEKDDGTTITLRHSGFRYLPQEIWNEVHQRYSAYWAESGILEQLVSLILADG